MIEIMLIVIEDKFLNCYLIACRLHTSAKFKID